MYGFKNFRPKLVIIDLSAEPQVELSNDEQFKVITPWIRKEHKAFLRNVPNGLTIKLFHAILTEAACGSTDFRDTLIDLALKSANVGLGEI